jgi:hypothetical protein
MQQASTGCDAQAGGAALRCRAHDALGGGVAAGAWPVLDDERLVRPLRKAYESDER